MSLFVHQPLPAHTNLYMKLLCLLNKGIQGCFRGLLTLHCRGAAPKHQQHPKETKNSKRETMWEWGEIKRNKNRREIEKKREEKMFH